MRNSTSRGAVCTMFLRALTTSAVVPILVSATAVAQAGQSTDPFEDRVTVTATGSEVRADEVPVVVTVIEKAEIENSLEETVGDLIRRVPGVQIFRNGDEGSITSAFVRGTESDQTLALFDGVRLNSPYFAGYDWSQLTTAGVEQVEVARGPYSAVWGSDAIGGVVNVISARGRQDLALNLQAEAGDDDWRRLQGTVNGGGERWDGLLSWFDREGETADLENSDFNNEQAMAKAGFRFGSEGQNRVGGLYQDLDSEIGVPVSNPLTLDPQPSPELAAGAVRPADPATADRLLESAADTVAGRTHASLSRP